MSATEIIEEIQKLPPSEQEQVLAFLQSARIERTAGDAGVRYASDADFDKTADRVLREHADLFRRLAQ
jgi:transcriptional regulator with AAA-type ATPase domain